MCQEFQCECCPDDLPQIDCVCDGCFHDDESTKSDGKKQEDPSKNLDGREADATKADVTSAPDCPQNNSKLIISDFFHISKSTTFSKIPPPPL
jgi:hypothetical protein